MRTDELKNLSSEVLRLRLQRLNLPITGSHTQMLERLRLVTKSPSQWTGAQKQIFGFKRMRPSVSEA